MFSYIFPGYFSRIFSRIFCTHNILTSGFFLIFKILIRADIYVYDTQKSKYIYIYIYIFNNNIIIISE